jgi:hypothetical protein
LSKYDLRFDQISNIKKYTFRKALRLRRTGRISGDER